MKLFMSVKNGLDEAECLKIALGYGANREPQIGEKVFDLEGESSEEDLQGFVRSELAEKGGFTAYSAYFSNRGYYWKGAGAEYRDVLDHTYGWAIRPEFTTLAERCETIEEMKHILDCLRMSNSSLRYWQGLEGGVCASQILWHLNGACFGPDENDTGRRQALIIKELMVRRWEGTVHHWAAFSSLWGGWMVSGNGHQPSTARESPKDFVKRILREDAPS